MAFISILFLIALLCMAVVGVICALAALVFALLHRKKRRRWMKIAGIVLGIIAAVNLLISGGFLTWAASF